MRFSIWKVFYKTLLEKIVVIGWKLIIFHDSPYLSVEIHFIAYFLKVYIPGNVKKKIYAYSSAVKNIIKVYVFSYFAFSFSFLNFNLTSENKNSKNDVCGVAV